MIVQNKKYCSRFERFLAFYRQFLCPLSLINCSFRLIISLYTCCFDYTLSCSKSSFTQYRINLQQEIRCRLQSIIATEVLDRFVVSTVSSVAWILTPRNPVKVSITLLLIHYEGNVQRCTKSRINLFVSCCVSAHPQIHFSNCLQSSCNLLYRRYTIAIWANTTPLQSVKGYTHSNTNTLLKVWKSRRKLDLTHHRCVEYVISGKRWNRISPQFDSSRTGGKRNMSNAYTAGQ